MTDKNRRAGAVRLLCSGALALALLVAGCGDGSGGSPAPTPAPTPAPSPTPAPTPTPTSRAAQVERDVLPVTVNAALPASDVANFEINPDPAVAPKGRLFVFLPGTSAAPRNYRTIVRTGAARGYHGIGLTYVNGTAVAELCSVGSTDLDCAGNARREIITGENVSALVSVNAENSVAGRLAALLAYLNRTYPAESWGQFLSGNVVNWSLVTVAGHSQGAGHTGYMAKLYTLDRTVMFSGPADVPAAGQIAARWLTLPNLTPLARQFGFTHIDDELVPYALARANWSAIGLTGPPFLIDGATPPFGGGNLFYTQAAPATAGGSRHGSPVADVYTPLNAQGTPVYTAIWNYMAFP